MRSNRPHATPSWTTLIGIAHRARVLSASVYTGIARIGLAQSMLRSYRPRAMPSWTNFKQQKHATPERSGRCSRLSSSRMLGCWLQANLWDGGCHLRCVARGGCYACRCWRWPHPSPYSQYSACTCSTQLACTYTSMLRVACVCMSAMLHLMPPRLSSAVVSLCVTEVLVLVLRSCRRVSVVCRCAPRTSLARRSRWVYRAQPHVWVGGRTRAFDLEHPIPKLATAHRAFVPGVVAIRKRPVNPAQNPQRNRIVISIFNFEIQLHPDSPSLPGRHSTRHLTAPSERGRTRRTNWRGRAGRGARGMGRRRQAVHGKALGSGLCGGPAEAKNRADGSFVAWRSVSIVSLGGLVTVRLTLNMVSFVFIIARSLAEKQSLRPEAEP